MQKRVIRIIMGCSYRESCRELFKELKILTLSSQFIFSLLLLFIVNVMYEILKVENFNFDMCKMETLL
jgi:hypothetical protein